MRTDRENRARGCARALAYVKRNAKFDSVLCVETFNAQFNFRESFLSQPVTLAFIRNRAIDLGIRALEGSIAPVGKPSTVAPLPSPPPSPDQNNFP